MKAETVETAGSTLKSFWLFCSFVVGLKALVVCWLARNYFMQSAPDWFTVDYTVIGWLLRAIGAITGMAGLLLALLARRGIQKQTVRRIAYRADVAMAVMAMVYEIAIPVFLLIVIISLIGGSVSRSIDASSLGCLGSGLDLFDFFDSDD